MPHPQWAPLEVSFVKADVKIHDQAATTFIEQEFYNPNASQLEGTFMFPIPKGAHLNKFTMEINGKPVEAELMAADKARGIYEDIVRKLKDPALLEYAGQGLIKVRIFPIEPHSKKRITLSYTQLLKSDSGLVEYILPLNTEKFSSRPIKTLGVKVELDCKQAIKSLYSVSHKVDIRRDGDKKATVGFEAANLKPETDFQLLFSTDKGEFGVSLLTYKPAGEDGYFLLLAAPGTGKPNDRVIPKDVVFVLDTSGSMAGNKLEQAKKALLFCVENLNDVDRFEVLRFSTDVEPLFNQITGVSKENRTKAREFIAKLKPLGGTAIDAALAKALAGRPEKSDRPYVIIFLTDGQPTVGECNIDQIMKNVTAHNQTGTRIFSFGIGTDVNTHLLDRITEETRAFSQYVLPDEDLEVKVSSFYTKIKEPVLVNPQLSFTRDIRISQAYPSPIPDMFKGEQLILLGRFTGAGDSAAILAGTVDGEKRQFTFDVRFEATASEHDFIPRLWATRRVGYLLDEIRLRGDNKELKDEVAELARKYGIVTPYTSYLIVEDERQRGVAQNVQTLPAAQQSQETAAYGMAFQSLNQQQSGGQAVAGARAFTSLKSASAPDAAIQSGNYEILRANPLMRRSTMGSVTRQSDSEAAQQITGQARYVNGRTFYLNNNIWLDGLVQKMSTVARIKITFNSTEYFDLMRKHPELKAWLALGPNVQFSWDGKVYEVAE